MRVWLLSFIVLFGAIELYQWVKEFILPLPVYVLGGAFLAIASNVEKGIFSQSGPAPAKDVSNSDNPKPPKH